MRHFSVSLLLLVVVGLAYGEKPTLPKAAHVSKDVIGEWKEKDVPFEFIDVREPIEYQAGHIPGARNIPFSLIESNQQEFSNEKFYAIYCTHSSWRAPYAANALLDLGVQQVFVLDGGIADWFDKGGALEASGKGKDAEIIPYPEDLSRDLQHPSYEAQDRDLLLTLDELSRFDGLDGRPAYVAVEGVVYDVTASRLWRGGHHDPSKGKAIAGRDLTELLTDAPHKIENVKRYPVVGRLLPDND